MQQRLEEVTDSIVQAAASLANGYEGEQLYALRVGVRRIRSMLKAIGSPRSRQFRKAWGGFAAVTNRARDWDVFLLTASELLPPPLYAEFERRHRGRVRATHEAVIELLQAAHWRRHLQEWRRYLRFANGEETGDTSAPFSLAMALSGARAALATARQSNSERAWHKLRIAVKDVRYQAESGANEPSANSNENQVIEHCKVIQSLLGSWHDCVVQLQILAELETSPEHEDLRGAIEERRLQRLVEIQQIVIGHPLFAVNGGPVTSERSSSSSGS